ncbi:MAG: DUF6512 family protein [Ruminococcus sp.]
MGFLWISVLGTLLHFTHSWSGGNPFIGLFSAVSESVWEHLKLIFFPAASYALLLCPFARKKCPACLTAFAAAAICAMAVLTMLYYTYSGILGMDLSWVNIGLFYGCAALTAGLGIHWSNRWQETGNLWGLAIITAIAICFFRFTAVPPDLGIFSMP